MIYCEDVICVWFPKDATTAAEVMATGMRFASETMEYAALGDNDTQAIQLMSSAKMSLKGMVAKVKVRLSGSTEVYCAVLLKTDTRKEVV